MPTTEKKRGWWKLPQIVPGNFGGRRPEDWTDEDKELIARHLATIKKTPRLRKEQQIVQQQQAMIREPDGKLKSGKERTAQALENMMEVRTWAVSLREFNDFPFFTT